MEPHEVRLAARVTRRFWFYALYKCKRRIHSTSWGRFYGGVHQLMKTLWLFLIFQIAMSFLLLPAPMPTSLWGLAQVRVIFRAKLANPFQRVGQVGYQIPAFTGLFHEARGHLF